MVDGGGGTEEGRGRGFLRSTEQSARRATPFLSDPHSRAKVRRKQLYSDRRRGRLQDARNAPTAAEGRARVFCGGGGAGTIARFSSATGDLEVVSAKGDVIF